MLKRCCTVSLNATILGQIISFVLFVWFCMQYVWPPIMAVIEKRQQEISEGIASAERAKKDLQAAQVHAADHLKAATEAAKLLIEQAHTRKLQIMDAAKAEAIQEHNKIVAQAKAEIISECKRAREELRKQVVMLAITCTEKIIERSVDEATNRDIIDKLITEL